MGGLMGRTRQTSALRCEQCGQDSVIQIELTLPDGTDVMFCSCHRCESRWWDHDGETLELDAVIDLARKPNQ